MRDAGNSRGRNPGKLVGKGWGIYEGREGSDGDAGGE